MNNNQNSNVGESNKKEEETPTHSSSSTNPSGSSGTTGTTSSSAGTCGTVSSADTVPTTQEVAQSQEELFEQEPAWGVLYPIDNNFYPIDLIEDHYTFGRVKPCSYVFDIPSIAKTQNFRSYSKQHFSITRSKSGSSGAYTIMINDLSMNGTFVNGEQLPSKGSRQLCDKDEIGMNAPRHKVLLFVDKNKEEDPNLPQEFKEKYIMHKVIGSGAYGEVRECLSKFDTRRHAVKIINKAKTIFANQNPEKVSSNLIQIHKNILQMVNRNVQVNRDVMKEARLLQTLDHPCVISVHDVIDSSKNLYIVLELAEGGELFNRLHSKGAFCENDAKLIFYQMLAAVSYLHENDVTHRDLKPENILMMSEEAECLIKITDFGVSRLVGESSFMTTQAGTPSYLAPEILLSFRSKSHEGYTRKIDSWSLGVILYVCLVAFPPFARDRTDTKQDLVTQIVNGNYNFNHSLWKNISEQAKDVIRSLLTVDAKERPSPMEALKHSWIQDSEMKDKARELMRIGPERVDLERELSTTSNQSDEIIRQSKKRNISLSTSKEEDGNPETTKRRFKKDFS